MKIIKYKFCTKVNLGTKESPEWVEVLDDKEICCPDDSLDIHEAIAKKEAYNGEYTIEDDEQEVRPTQDERIAELEEALDMLLNGVTE